MGERDSEEGGSTTLDRSYGGRFDRYGDRSPIEIGERAIDDGGPAVPIVGPDSAEAGPESQRSAVDVRCFSGIGHEPDPPSSRSVGFAAMGALTGSAERVIGRGIDAPSIAAETHDSSPGADAFPGRRLAERQTPDSLDVIDDLRRGPTGTTTSVLFRGRPGDPG